MITRSLILLTMLCLLTGCNDAPSESDMRGCAIRGGGPAISHREVADCAVERAARHEEKVK